MFGIKNKKQDIEILTTRESVKFTFLNCRQDHIFYKNLKISSSPRSSIVCVELRGSAKKGDYVELRLEHGVVHTFDVLSKRGHTVSVDKKVYKTNEKLQEVLTSLIKC